MHMTGSEESDPEPLEKVIKVFILDLVKSTVDMIEGDLSISHLHTLM